MTNYPLMTKTLQILKEDIGASPLTPVLKSYMIGLVNCLEQYLPHLYVMLPRVVDESEIFEEIQETST